MKDNNQKKITTFEDLRVYKMARELSRTLSRIIKILPNHEEYNLKGQMRRAKLSVANNIAEGFGRYHYQENIQFCRQARGSIFELIGDFNECLDEKYIDEADFIALRTQAYELIEVLNGYIFSIKRFKGSSSNKESIITKDVSTNDFF